MDKQKLYDAGLAAQPEPATNDDIQARAGRFVSEDDRVDFACAVYRERDDWSELAELFAAFAAQESAAAVKKEQKRVADLILERTGTVMDIVQMRHQLNSILSDLHARRHGVLKEQTNGE